MPKATTEDGLQISYRVLGQGDQDLVFVHGWMVSGAVYDDVLETIDKSKYRLIVPDLRGTGDSGTSASAYSLSSYVEDVKAVVDDAGADNFGLVGHSMGGQIAQLFAATYPDRVDRMALLCSVPASGIDLPEEADQLFYNSGENRESQAAILGMACLDLQPAAKERLLDDAGQIPAECIQQAYRAWTGGGFTDKLSDITAATLVVGSDDPFLPPDFLKAAIVDPIPRAEFTHIEGAGHYVQVERTEETVALLENFFS